MTHDHVASHDHTHGVIDPSLFSTERGIRALKWSLAGLMTTAVMQVIVVYFTGSVALLADTIHNFGDALTAVPLWIAFRVGEWKPNKRFTYGYGRVEDLAGAFIVFMILLSAAIAGYESFQRLFNPQPVQHIWAVALASVIGFIGNEAVAWYRIKVGKEIGSAALVADGQHARVDGLTSLAVLAGAVGVWLGFPLADPLVGLGITVAILRIVWDSGKQIFARIIDGVDGEVVDEIEHAVSHVPGVQAVTDVRVRWLGHRMRAELCVAVDPVLTVEPGHDIAKDAHHELLEHLPYLSSATIHIDPANASGDDHHHVY
ncbi:MAG: cation diffusion facilitator family transporter [Anaerolineales bacterium]